MGIHVQFWEQCVGNESLNISTLYIYDSLQLKDGVQEKRPTTLNKDHPSFIIVRTCAN